MLAEHLVIDVATGKVSTIPVTAEEQAVSDAGASAEQAAEQRTWAAVALRVEDAATLLNMSSVREAQAFRDAFARLLGVEPLTIPLTQDATPADITVSKGEDL